MMMEGIDLFGAGSSIFVVPFNSIIKLFFMLFLRVFIQPQRG
jgi:hypothetical protein